MEQETEKKVTKKKNNYVTKHTDPELYEAVIEKRNKNLSWTEISKEMEESKWGKMTPKLLSTIYNRAISKTIMTERKSGEKFDEFGKELKRLFRRAISSLDSQLMKIEKVDELVDINEIDDQKILIKYLKLAPTMNSTIQQIFSAIKVYQEQQDKIREEIKGAVWDDNKLLDRMDTMLENMKSEGWVIIPPKIKDGR